MEERAQQIEARAKALRPGDSGVHRIRHAANLTAAVQDTSPDSAPRQVSTGQVRSAARRVTRVEAAAAFDAAVSTLRILEVDIAAALDESRQRVAEMRRGDRPIQMEHLVLLHRRLPALFEAYSMGLFGGAE